MNTPMFRKIAARFLYLRRITMAAIGERLAPLGMGVPEYLVLFRLVAEEEVPQRELEQDTGLGASGVSRLLSKLGEEGLVSVRTDPRDRRRRVVRITEAGRAREEELAPLVDEAARSVMNDLSEEEERTLLVLLEKAGGSAGPGEGAPR